MRRGSCKYRRMPGAVHQPRFGELRFRGSDDGYVTEVIEIPALRGHRCELLFQDYVDDPDRGQIDAAIEALFAPGADLLALARPHVAQYREDMLAFFAEQEIEVDVAALPEPDAIWSQVQLGKTCLVSRRAKGDDDDGILGGGDGHGDEATSHEAEEDEAGDTADAGPGKEAGRPAWRMAARRGAPTWAEEARAHRA
jgi:hypothetical protein